MSLGLSWLAAMSAALGPGSPPPPPAMNQTPLAGSRALRIAQAQVGVAEQPLGSNRGPQVDAYAQAVTGSSPGTPWSGHFVSWVAREAEAPLGRRAQGFGLTGSLESWARRSGRWRPSPRPGRLWVGRHHVGVVESVSVRHVTIIAGNQRDQVTRSRVPRASARGYVLLQKR